jgi:hypothetical protein
MLTDHTMRMYRGQEEKLHTFLTFRLDGGEQTDKNIHNILTDFQD